MIKDFRCYVRLESVDKLETVGLSAYVDIEDELLFLSFHDASKTHSTEIDYDYHEDDLGLVLLEGMKGFESFDWVKYGSSLESFSMKLTEADETMMVFYG